MSLPLQPTGQPWPPAIRRAALLAVLVLAVLALGWVAPRRGRPPQVVLGGGVDQEMAYAREARRLIEGARTRLWMAMFVIRPDDGPVGGLLDALAAAAARGVDVRVALDRGNAFDGSPDPKHEAPAAWLAAHGVRAVVDEAGVTTHAKVLVADSRLALAGSHNWTRNALVANRELSWLIDDPASAQRIEAWLAAIPGW